MAYIEKRTKADGSAAYRVQVRRKGQPARAKTFRRRTDALKWARQVETDIDQRKVGAVTPTQLRTTVGQLVEAYLSDKATSLTPVDCQRRTKQLMWWLGRFGDRPVLELHPNDVAEGIADLKVGKGPSGKRIAGSTINRYVAALTAVYSWAVKTRRYGLPRNPLLGAQLRESEPRGRVRFLDHDEQRRLLAACQDSWDPRLFPLVLVAMTTGMRQGELLGLTWKRVDLEEGWALLNDTKNDERRQVPITGPAIKVLREWRRTQRQHGDNRVFAPRLGGAFIPRSAWELALKEADINDFRFHDLRHTAASYLAQGGATLSDIGEILGHKTPAMTRRYAHLTRRRLRTVMQQMTDHFIVEQE